jgi:hypothetical protein
VISGCGAAVAAMAVMELSERHRRARDQGYGDERESTQHVYAHTSATKKFHRTPLPSEKQRAFTRIEFDRRDLRAVPESSNRRAGRLERNEITNDVGYAYCVARVNDGNRSSARPEKEQGPSAVPGYRETKT